MILYSENADTTDTTTQLSEIEYGQREKGFFLLTLFASNQGRNENRFS
jgi:hypothetical protein